MDITLGGVTYANVPPIMLDVLEDAADALDRFQDLTASMKASQEAGERVKVTTMVGATTAAAEVVWHALKRSKPDLTFAAFKASLSGTADLGDLATAVTDLSRSAGMKAKGETQPLSGPETDPGNGNPSETSSSGSSPISSPPASAPETGIASEPATT